MPHRSVVEAPNPLREGLRIKQSTEPCVMVIFGATGDLTHRKLLPALYDLALEHPLPAGFSVVGFARRPYSDDDFASRPLNQLMRIPARSLSILRFGTASPLVSAIYNRLFTTPKATRS